MTMRIMGHLDSVSPREIRGWALIAGQDEPARIEIKINDADYTVVTADLLRPGMKTIGVHPTGHCGFLVQLPEDAALKLNDLVSARVVGAEQQLPGSPMRCKAPLGQGPGLMPDLPAVEAGTKAAQEDVLPSLPVFPPAPERSSWQIFRASFMAFFLREVKSRFGAHRFGYAWAIAEPVMYILILQSARFIIGRGRLGTEIAGVDGIYYFALGIIPFFVFLRAFNSSQGAIGASKGLFNYRQLKPIDVILVRVLIETVTMLIAFAIIIFGLWWFGRPIEMENPIQFLAALFLLFVFAAGVGLYADVYITRNNDVRRITGMLERPLFFISGIFFTMRDIPEGLLAYLTWNPIFHAIDLSRGAMLSKYDSPGSWTYLFLCSAAALLLGLAAYRRNLFRLTQQ